MRPILFGRRAVVNFPRAEPLQGDEFRARIPWTHYEFLGHEFLGHEFLGHITIRNSGDSEFRTDIITLFDFPSPIRKAISTTNAIESVNGVSRKFTRNRKIYPNEESALKITFMPIREASKKWTMPIENWKAAPNHFAILFEDRLPMQFH